MAHHHEFPAGEEPLFNIGAASRMTGIAEATLRVWERRYGFPQSARTAGGHRLYSQQEITRLRWVKLRMDEGMQIRQAIRALHHFEQEGAALRAPATSTAAAAGEAGADSLSVLQQRLFNALLQQDAALADQVLADAEVLFPLESLILDVIGPIFAAIGEAWSEGRVDVAAEHYATHFLRHRLVLWMRNSPPAYQARPAILTCAPGELHEGSLLMLAALLQRLRWPVIYLGQTMPLEELGAFVREAGAAVIVFVAMTEPAALALAEWPRWLPDAAETGRPAVTYGGRAFVVNPELAERVPGTLLGATLREGIDTLNRLLHEMNPLLR
ncbi:MAG TPA: MerR family transcriptional regulator [Aggregatilineaceae bacterium]|nr:MerR family transcriptional regulator [Anaerolineae bacterium]HMM29777.1 MerR family transcriptional regulator [Aggregatilineaceae bacterium]